MLSDRRREAHLPNTVLYQQCIDMFLTPICSFVVREYRQPMMVAFSFKIYDNDTYGLGCQGLTFNLLTTVSFAKGN